VTCRHWLPPHPKHQGDHCKTHMRQSEFAVYCSATMEGDHSVALTSATAAAAAMRTNFSILIRDRMSRLKPAGTTGTSRD
jgi:hypothetical protein